ncbi:hypothetical protein Q4485_06105 [Granulosicoccaceae sp. 1_MG-2023]|nr:hypothetical protein [Granulosicoccaceae sp. 1_MG-2023]
MIRAFFYLHLAGLLVLLAGLVWYFGGDADGRTTGTMVAISSLLGLGLMMISPWPVVKAIQWMMKSSGR